MSALTMGGSVMMGAIIYGKELYHFLKPRRIGVYGPTMVGKTTLDRYMTTPGEMEHVEDRTLHPKRLLGEVTFYLAGPKNVLGGRESVGLSSLLMWADSNDSGTYGLTTW